MGCTPSKQVDASKEGSNGSDYGMFRIIPILLLAIVLHRIVLYPIVICRNIRLFHLCSLLGNPLFLSHSC